MKSRTSISLITGAVIVAVVFSVVSMYRPLSGLENVLLQIFSLAIGMAGSYVLGRESASAAARELVKPHARSAFRRLLSLYSSLSRLALAIQNARPSGDTASLHVSVLDKLEVMVTEQIVTADDALDDWRDIVPEEVEELRARLAARRTAETQK
jgi:hypothetical protein